MQNKYKIMKMLESLKNNRFKINQGFIEMIIQHRYEELIQAFQTDIRDQKMFSAYLFYINGTSKSQSPLILYHENKTYPIVGGFSDSRGLKVLAKISQKIKNKRATSIFSTVGRWIGFRVVDWCQE